MRERTILFVDDEEKSRKYFGRIFRGSYEIITAGDGREALAVFLERRDEIGLVVTDQMMPRMTGLELLRELGAGAPEVVRILSTAYADSELVAEAAKGGLIDHFIRKPWDIEGVGEILSKAAAQFERNMQASAGIGIGTGTSGTSGGVNVVEEAGSG